jgi:hypothetical protein
MEGNTICRRYSGLLSAIATRHFSERSPTYAGWLGFIIDSSRIAFYLSYFLSKQHAKKGHCLFGINKDSTGATAQRADRPPFP